MLNEIKAHLKKYQPGGAFSNGSQNSNLFPSMQGRPGGGNSSAGWVWDLYKKGDGIQVGNGG